MGTWAAGPFGNDAALDLTGEVVENLMEFIDAFLAEPYIDETFDEGFAAMALLNLVMETTPTRPWDLEASAVRDPAPIVAAFLRCFDEQIDGMEPRPTFKVEQRAALVAECDRFSALLTG